MRAALRAAFAWLVDVRYLAGNPWTVVSDPVRIERESELYVERALPATLWERMRSFIGDQCQRDDARYWRSVRVALLLGADSGLRREELASARRERLAPTTHGDGVEAVWQLQVIGKRKKERTVPVSPATIAALNAHWRDRGEDFYSRTAGPFLAPIFIPPGKEAQKKHADGAPLAYHTDTINFMVENGRGSA